MEYQTAATEHRKRRRRRRADRFSISGWLVPSEQFKGNIGKIPQELFAELFQHTNSQDEAADGRSDVRYVAITPWSPITHNLVEDAIWTVLPVLAQKESEEESVKRLGALTIQFPARSPALQTFAEALQTTSSIRGNIRGKGVEIRMLDVSPLQLDTIYVTVDGDSLDKHDETQKRYGGGFASSWINGSLPKGKAKVKATPNGDIMGDGKKVQEDKLTSAVREALASSLIVRQNDLLSLPLPAHPITHVSLQPARISLCEPVGQGLLSESTKIVINRISHADLADRGLPSIAAQKVLRGMILENGYDTSSEQFVSAVEEVEYGSSPNDAAETTSDPENPGEDSGSSSDNSMENMISMDAPQIPIRSSGVLSSRTPATPRIGRPMTNGINTPGSIFSNFTVSTARQGSIVKGKLFKATGLLGRIPDELLHPKPSNDEDEEARVFVDIKSLIKLGCFSGDWVKLEAAPAPEGTRPSLWAANAFDRDGSSSDFRPAKVYGLPDLSTMTTPQYQKRHGFERRSSILSMPGMDTPGPVAWLSPILLSNLAHATHVRLSSLTAKHQESSAPRPTMKKAKIDRFSSPPVAKELTILRISTPLSTERSLQTGIFTALKQYFESKRRIVRQGDIIALPVDTSVSRLLAQPAGASEVDHEVEELLGLPSDEHTPLNGNLDIAWFRVGQVLSSESSDEFRHQPSELWGGAACIEPMTTRMRQAGSESSKIPSSLNSSWRNYLGITPSTKSAVFQSAIGQSVGSLPKPHVAPLRRRLRELFAAATSSRAVHLGMEPVVVLLHSTQRNIGKANLAIQAASDLGLHCFHIDAYDMLAESGSAGDVKTEALFKARVERALTCGAACTTILVRHVEALTADRMVVALKELISDLRVLIATTTEIENIPDGVRSLFTHELEIVAPDEGEREGTLRSIVEDRGLRLAHDVDLASTAVKTAALVAGNLVDVVDRASVARQERLDHLVSKDVSDLENHQQFLIRDVLVSGGESARCVTKADFDVAVEAARKNFADAIGAPKIPNVSWDDVGGLENVKDAVMETIQLPLERPELFAKGMKKRSGILFYGPPGTGKTLLAKAIATEFSLNFFSVKGPELLNMYIGESEANVRRVFQRARDARPCVVFFDELDSVAPKRGNQGDSGGVMDRIVSQLLAELDGMSDGDEGGSGVFVIGATNRPDLLDQALLRPGRFDKMLYLGVSDTHSKQLTILEALTRKFAMNPETSLRSVAESLPFTYTGADLYALCSDAMLKAITRQANAVDAKIKALPGGPVTTAYFFDYMATDEDIAVMVTEEDFFAANRELVGSVR
jgi:peroxin-6